MERQRLMPFELATTQRIMTGEINGEVVTVFGRRVRLETYDETDPEFPLIGEVEGDQGKKHWSVRGGNRENYTNLYDLQLSFPNPFPDFEFNTFDRIVGILEGSSAEEWKPDLFRFQKAGFFYGVSGDKYTFCLPYSQKTKELIGTRKKFYEITPYHY